MKRTALARLPTPIQYLPRVSAWLECEVHVKRDDLTAYGMSGNKVRKLEYLLSDALDRGARTVITCGGVQSNHCRATAVACRRLGLEPVLLLRGAADHLAEPDGNLLLDTLLGAEIIPCTHAEYQDRGRILAELADRFERSYVIPEGGSNALGAHGFAVAAEEVAEQADPFDVVVVAVGSGGTLAGLTMGPHIGALRGIAVCDDRAFFRGVVDSISPAGGSYDVLDGWQGEAYGVAGPEVWAVIRRVAQLEGLFLDPTYTGKAFTALVDKVRAGEWGGRILFWHTGGAFGLFGRGGEL